MNELVLPGRKRGRDTQSALAMEILQEVYLEFHHSRQNNPFKMLRADRYFWELDAFLTNYMQPTKGGEKFDNRRRTVE